jgi:hypothetical protein
VYHVRFKSRLFRHFTLQQKLDGTETRAPLPPDPAPLVVLKLSSTRAQQLVLMDKSRATDEELDFLGPRRRGRRFCCARSSARWATTMQLDAFNKVRTLAGDVLHAFLDLYPCARRRSGSSSSARALPRGPASPPAATRDPGGAARPAPGECGARPHRAAPRSPGLVYFAGEDRVYSIDLFYQLRSVR